MARKRAEEAAARNKAALGARAAALNAPPPPPPGMAERLGRWKATGMVSLRESGLESLPHQARRETLRCYTPESRTAAPFVS